MILAGKLSDIISGRKYSSSVNSETMFCVVVERNGREKKKGK